MKPDWLDREAYPFDSHFMELGDKRMHYVDEGSGDPVVMVHGTPSWSFEYRHIIRQLLPNYRCIAPDHIGFGLSDKPKEYEYSTPRHADNLRQLIEQLDLEQITLIVHDFGGPIGFKYALEHPDNIRQLIIMNTWMWSFEDNPQYRKMKPILKSFLMPLLYKYLNVSAAYLLPNSFADKQKLTKEVKRHYTRPFGSSSERMGTVGFARSLVDDQDWFDELWERRSAIADKRTLFIWGILDKLIGPRFLDRFERHFPNSQSIRFDDAGHFPQEERSNAVAADIEGWLSSIDGGH